MKTLEDIILQMEKFAPPELAAFDFVGLLQGDPRQTVSRIGLTLDYSLQAIDRAIEEGCQLLVTHHGPKELAYPLLGNNLAKVSAAAKANLAVYRCHLNLDFCNGGVIEELCNLLQIPARSVSTSYGVHRIIGGVRLAKDYPMTFNELIQRAAILKHPYIRIAGKKRDQFKRIAITSGRGFISEFFDQLRPEVYIAGEFEQGTMKYAEDMGIMLVELSHHASEARPLEMISMKLAKRLGVPVSFIEIADTIKVITNNKV